MVSVLVLGSSGPGLSPAQCSFCYILGQESRYSHSASLHPGLQMRTRKFNAVG